MNLLTQLLDEVFEDHAGALTDDLPFADAPGFDSLRHAALIVGVEQRFGVELSRADIAALTSRGAVRDLLRAKGHDV